jgi:hypothetical protein
VKLLLGDVFEGAECVDAGVVDEDVETTVVLDCRVDNILRLARLRDITLDGDGLAAGLLDDIDGGIGARFARGVVDDDGGAFRREGFGNGGSDSLDAPVTTATLSWSCLFISLSVWFTIVQNL